MMHLIILQIMINLNEFKISRKNYFILAYFLKIVVIPIAMKKSF